MKKIPNVNKKKKVGNHFIYMNKLLGKGSFSKVYRGVQQSTSQQVAIKIVDKNEIQQDQYTIDAFFSEIYILKQLKSPNIIKFINVQETHNNYYLITQLAEGGTLRELLKTKKFSQSEALKYMVQILKGIKQLIKFGIIHRDLKPENILIKNDILKIADFGFAKKSDNNSFMRSIVGTPIYMSPQILTQQKYSYKCDIWAIGVIFYQLVVGKIPWNLLQHPQVIQSIKNAILYFPQQLGVSLQLQNFIKNCLAYDQKDRYDWESIFSHQLFISHFKNNFVGDKKNNLKITFIISDLRMSIHSKNINLVKLLNSVPQQLDALKFSHLMFILDENINQNEITQLFQELKKSKKNQGDKISQTELRDFFKSIGVRMQSLDIFLSQKRTEQNEKMIDQTQQMSIQQKRKQKKNYFLFSRLSKKIQQKDIDVHQLYRKQDINSQNALQLSQFTSLILTIDNTLEAEQVLTLFKQFDLNNDQIISFNQYYSTLCKITGTVKNAGKLF